MKTSPRIVLTILLTTFVFTAVSYAADYIRVGSFNIANFGMSKTGEYERSLVSLVNIILEMDADVIALQEIQPNDLGTKQVERLTKLLNKAASYKQTPLYDSVIAEEHTGDETVAYLWRDPVTLESDISLLEHEEDPDDDDLSTFQRVPHYALFTAGNYEFYLVNCHLYTKPQSDSSEGRGDEFDAIVEWLKDLAGETEKDAVIVGDFNRFLNGKNAWKQLMIQGHSQWFRFPLLEAIKAETPAFDPKTDDAPEDKYSTTTSESKRIYDQILVSSGSYNEFTTSPQFGVDVGIVAFDQEEQFKWATKKWNDAIKMLTDHRPIWIRLRTDKTDDD
ncbi:MAG TPA: endonuclease/exonuclease/phosphatase family protein [Sedimentisphaerales bacterium]|jgi:endonuclease/exonuclease/phosphatase family metal-dependent hydrolase|nr:endonuclease/exonuclease/phosphatase family protein [Sedimentisphaerales bacterium]